MSDKAVVSSSQLSAYIKSIAKELRKGHVELLEDLSTVMLSLSLLSGIHVYNVIGLVLDDFGHWALKVKNSIPIIYSAMPKEEADVLISEYFKSLNEASTLIEKLAEELKQSPEGGKEVLSILGKISEITYKLSIIARRIVPPPEASGET